MIKPQFTSPDLRAKIGNLTKYSWSGDYMYNGSDGVLASSTLTSALISFKAGSDGAVSGYTFTSATASFKRNTLEGKTITLLTIGTAVVLEVTSSTTLRLDTSFSVATAIEFAFVVGETVAVKGVGYALVTAYTSEHVLAIDAALTGSGKTFCVGGFARTESEAFTTLQWHAKNGYVNRKLEIRVPGLKRATGKLVISYTKDDSSDDTDYEDVDLLHYLGDDDTLFNDAHKCLTLSMICTDLAFQGGTEWKDKADQNTFEYAGSLDTAIQSYVMAMKDACVITDATENEAIVGIRVKRV